MKKRIFILIFTSIWALNYLTGQAVSDECIDANDLVLDVNNFVSVTFNTNDVTASANPPSCQANPRDGWYKLIMPFDGNILISGSSNTEYAVYDGCGGNELRCTRLGNHTFNLVNGTTYFIRAWRINGTTGNMTLNLTATPTISNDECNTAQVLGFDVDNYSAGNVLNTNGATISADPISCQTSPRDGWYSFIMPFNGNALITGSSNTEYAIYDGCGGNQVFCNSGGNHAFNLKNGHDYKLRVYRTNGIDGSTTFNVRLTELITNDECNMAHALVFDGNNYSGGNVLNTNGATISTDPISCETNPRDGWYSFNMPFDGNALITGSSNTEYAIYNGCGGNQVFCNREGKHAYSLNQGNTYYLRTYRRNGVDGNMTFNVQLTQAVSNDECVDALWLQFNANNNSFNNFNTNGATISIGDPSCQLNPRDGWYRFTSLIEGSYQLNGGANTEFAIYDGCGGNQLACFRDGGSFDVNLGKDYLIRSWKTNGADGNMSVDLIGTEIVLPVILSKFVGIVSEFGNLLKWTTQSEVNTDYFIIEKSLDLKSWNSVGKVNAIGNTSNTQEYRFKDSRNDATVYYRLKIMDRGGYYEYSEVISIKRNQSADWSIYPNPVRDILYIKGIHETGTARIYNYAGHNIKAISVYDNHIDLTDLNPGMYLLAIDGQYGVVRKPFIKVE